MKRLSMAAGICLLAALLVVVACRGGNKQAPESALTSEPTADATSEIPESEIRLLFPGPDDEYLHVEKRRVLPIDSPEERAKQCLEELFRGPTPSPGLLAAVPDGVRVRQVYILPSGIAYADVSAELLKHRGGSLGELQTIYSIVDTLALNVPQIKRIAILVNGQTRQTLAGHVFMAQPLAPDYDYVEESARPATAGGAPPGAAQGEKQKPGEEVGDPTDPAPGDDAPPETPHEPSVSDTV